MVELGTITQRYEAVKGRENDAKYSKLRDSMRDSRMSD